MRKAVAIVLALAFLMMSTAVAPVLADSKAYNSKVIRDYSYMPDVSTPYGVFDVEQYATMHITEWARQDGGSRTLITGIVNVEFLQSGEVVGQGTTHSVANMIVPEWPFTLVNHLDVVVTFRGSGQVVSYHLTMVYVNGELLVFHEVGVP